MMQTVVVKENSVISNAIPGSYHIQAGVKARIMHTIDYASESPLALTFILEKESELDYYLIVAGSSVPETISITCVLQGEHAHARINGAYSLWDHANVTIKTEQIHTAPNASSQLQINGIVCDQSRIAYHGMIHIEQHAHHTCASQENKTLLFSSGARALSVPSLQVLADKVSCAHGSAIGKLDQELLALLQMRGISYKKAQEMLVEGFFFDLVCDPSILRQAQDENYHGESAEPSSGRTDQIKPVRAEEAECNEAVSKHQKNHFLSNLLYPLQRETL